MIWRCRYFAVAVVVARTVCSIIPKVVVGFRRKRQSSFVTQFHSSVTTAITECTPSWLGLFDLCAYIGTYIHSAPEKQGGIENDSCDTGHTELSLCWKIKAVICWVGLVVCERHVVVISCRKLINYSNYHLFVCPGIQLIDNLYPIFVPKAWIVTELFKLNIWNCMYFDWTLRCLHGEQETKGKFLPPGTSGHFVPISQVLKRTYDGVLNQIIELK